MASVGPFRFEWGDYPARRLHPLSKLAALVALSVASTASRGAWLPFLALAVLVALASAGAFRSGLRKGLSTLARDARFLVGLGLFVAAFRVVDPWGPSLLRLEELAPALLYVARLALVFAFAEAFFRSTSAEELAAAATLLARRLFRRVDLDPGLYLSLAVNFIPRCFEAYGRAREAALARGYGGRRGRRPRFASSLAVLESFIAGSIRAGLSAAEALESRGYSPARVLGGKPFRPADAALAAAASGLAVLALAL